MTVSVDNTVHFLHTYTLKKKSFITFPDGKSRPAITGLQRSGRLLQRITSAAEARQKEMKKDAALPYTGDTGICMK